jgi:hypothetical protein
MRGTSEPSPFPVPKVAARLLVAQAQLEAPALIDIRSARRSSRLRRRLATDVLEQVVRLDRGALARER